MSDPPDLDALARRYLDLWQEQLADLAADRQVADIMARTIELMNSGVAAFAAMAGGGEPTTGRDPNDGDEDPEHRKTPQRRSGAATETTRGTAAVAPARRPADDGMAELARRVAALEQRVAALEADGGGSRAGAKGRPRKRRT